MKQSKSRPVRIVFMATIPIGAVIAVMHFASVVVQSFVRVLEILIESARLG